MCSFKKYLRSHVNRLNFIKSCLVLLTKALKAYTFDILLHYSHFPLLHTHIDGLSAAAVLLSVCITCLMSSYFPIFLYRFTFQNQSLYCWYTYYHCHRYHMTLTFTFNTSLAPKPCWWSYHQSVLFQHISLQPIMRPTFDPTTITVSLYLSQPASVLAKTASQSATGSCLLWLTWLFWVRLSKR